jgi:hypothetical protein
VVLAVAAVLAGAVVVAVVAVVAPAPRRAACVWPRRARWAWSVGCWRRARRSAMRGGIANLSDAPASALPAPAARPGPACFSFLLQPQPRRQRCVADGELR